MSRMAGTTPQRQQEKCNFDQSHQKLNRLFQFLPRLLLASWKSNDLRHYAKLILRTEHVNTWSSTKYKTGAQSNFSLFNTTWDAIFLMTETFDNKLNLIKVV